MDGFVSEVEEGLTQGGKDNSAGLTAAPSSQRESASHCMRQGVSTLGDAWSFSGLTSKIPPLGSMLNFDADVKKKIARHQCCETASRTLPLSIKIAVVFSARHCTSVLDSAVFWCRSCGRARAPPPVPF